MRRFFLLAFVVVNIEVEITADADDNASVVAATFDDKDARYPQPITDAGVAVPVEIDVVSSEEMPRQSSSSTVARTLSKAVLSILCFLGDAAVDKEAACECRYVVVPPDYEEICGRWQCSDPCVDTCYFTDHDSILSPELSPPTRVPSSLQSLNDPIQNSSLRNSLYASDPAIVDDRLKRRKRSLLARLYRKKNRKVRIALRTEVSVNDSLNVIAIDENSPLIAEPEVFNFSRTLHIQHASKLLHTQHASRFPLRRRPVSLLRDCDEPSFGEVFGVVKVPQCIPDVILVEATQQPACSSDEWERDVWRDLFLEQRRAQETDRSRAEATNASSSSAIVNETVRLWRRKNQCRLAEPFWQCDAYNGNFLSSVWRRFGESLVDKLDGSADLDATPTVVLGTGFSPTTNNTTSTGSKAQQWWHCANEGELCLCTGDVRFGVVGQWAPDILSVRHGIVSCSADLFAGASSPPDGTSHVCECSSGHLEGPLKTPSLATMSTSEKLMRINDSKLDDDSVVEKKTKPRFIRGTNETAIVDPIKRGIRYDYASVGAGARMVKYAPGVKRAKSVLAADNDYLQTVCDDRAWFVVSLLEDLFLEQIGLKTLEFFASGFRHLQILGSSMYPTDQWRLLGEIETNATATHEIFDVRDRCKNQAERCWIRFLKVRVLSHHQLEQNTYCALTQFQAFGSTSIAYIAEEKKAQDDAGRQIEPNVANIADWHDKAARDALSSLFGEDVDSVAQQYTQSEEHGNHDDSSNGEDMSNGDIDDSLAESPNVLSLMKNFAKKISSTFINRQLPRIGSGREGVESETEAVDLGDDGSNGNATSEEKATEPASTTERARHSLSEVLQDLNASGTLSDADLSTFERLRATLASLNGSGADLVAAASPFLGSGVLPTTSAPAPPPKPKTSSSTPVLVQISEEVNDVKDRQASLEKKMKGVASGLSSVLVFIVEALREHDSQVRNIVDAQEPLRDFLLQTTSATSTQPLFNSSEVGGISGLGQILRSFILRGMLDNCSYQMFSFITFDRCLILLLFVWNMWLRRSGESREKPAGEPTSDTDHQMPVANSTKRMEINSYTISGADKERLLREYKEQTYRKHSDRSHQNVTDTEAEREHCAALSSSAYYPQQSAKPPLDVCYTEGPSTDDGSDPESPKSPKPYQGFGRSWFELLGLEREGSSSSTRRTRRRPHKALHTEAGGRQRGPKRHSSAARRHFCKKT